MPPHPEEPDYYSEPTQAARDGGYYDEPAPEPEPPRTVTASPSTETNTVTQTVTVPPRRGLFGGPFGGR